jgi:glyoxylase-like metal-dependent hydrolase (beta-lactamase superfamily II)
MSPSLSRTGLVPSLMVAHCLLIEGDDGLTLVDTGFGTDDVAEGARRLGRAFTSVFGPRLDPSETALSQLTALGFRSADVHDIVVTHLDLDHAGGLADFPHARVHVHRAELDAALHPAVRDRARYLQAQWDHGPHWIEHSTGGDEWLGFASARAVGEDVVLVPLHGHSRGHSGVAVRRPDGGWLLHAGDAYFHVGDLERPRRCPPALRAFQRAAASDQEARRTNLARLQQLRADRSGEVTVFCAHDATELEALQRAPS